jgi:hypothetical protein
MINDESNQICMFCYALNKIGFLCDWKKFISVDHVKAQVLTTAHRIFKKVSHISPNAVRRGFFYIAIRTTVVLEQKIKAHCFQQRYV